MPPFLVLVTFMMTKHLRYKKNYVIYWLTLAQYTKLDLRDVYLLIQLFILYIRDVIM